MLYIFVKLFYKMQSNDNGFQTKGWIIRSRLDGNIRNGTVLQRYPFWPRKSEYKIPQVEARREQVSILHFDAVSPHMANTQTKYLYFNKLDGRFVTIVYRYSCYIYRPYNI